MQMKALAASFTGNIQEEALPHSRRWCCGSTAEQASKESTHDDLQGACNLLDSVEEVLAGPFYVSCRDCQASSTWWLACAMCRRMSCADHHSTGCHRLRPDLPF